MTALTAVTAIAAPTLISVGAFDISFYNMGDGDEGGSSTQNWTTQQMDDVVASVVTWTSNISNTPGRQVRLHVFWDTLGSSTLGQTLSPRSGNGTTSWTYAEHVWRDGVNYSVVTSYDVRMDFSTGINWNYGAELPTMAEYDFRTVVTHEVGHSLGFVSSYSSFFDRFSSQGLSMWDKNLVDSSGNRPAAGKKGTPRDFDELDNPVYFTGSNAAAKYGGPVPVYAPTTYSSGSSLSHLDETALPAALMSPFVAKGQAIRAPTALEWEIMKDLGWAIGSTKTWSRGAGTLNWGDAGNWSPTGAPDAAWNVVFASAGIADGETVLLGSNRAVKTLRIETSAGFTIGGTSGTLTIQDGNLTRTDTASNTHTIARPVVLGGDAVWDIAQPTTGSGKLVLAGTLSSEFAFFKNGNGMLTLANTATLGDVSLNAGDLTLAAGGALTATHVSGQGSLNFDGGTLTLTGANMLHLYGVRVGKEATGSFTLQPGKTLWTDVFLTVGRDAGGQGAFVNQGGTIIADTNLFVGVYAGSTGLFTQQASPNPGDPAPTTTVAQTTYVGYQGGAGHLEMKAGDYTTSSLQVGPGGPGTVTHSGGTLRVANSLQLAGDGTSGTYNLNGGTLVTSQLTRAVGTGQAAFNFGGGTLRAAAAMSSSLPITLQTGGGTIDTNGFDVVLSGAMDGVGGLTKTGAGTLLLTEAPTYEGDTLVAEGTLQIPGLDNNGSTTVAGTLLIDYVRQTSLTIGAGGKVEISSIIAPGGANLAATLSSLDPLPAAEVIAPSATAVFGEAPALGEAPVVASAATLVPEPATWLLMLLAAASLLPAMLRGRR